MKTVAITIDEGTLDRIDTLVSRDRNLRSRSELFRRALQEFLNSLDRTREEERQREIFHRHRALLRQQAFALLKEQAHP